MVKIIVAESKLDCEHLLGQYLDESHFDTVINEDTDCYKESDSLLDTELSERRIAFKFRKNFFSQEEQDQAYLGLREAATESQNRGMAAGPRGEVLGVEGRGGRDWVTDYELEILDFLMTDKGRLIDELSIEGIRAKHAGAPRSNADETRGAVWLRSQVCKAYPEYFGWFDKWVDSLETKSKEDVAKEAKKHVNVVLNGDGADELFAGYRRYVPFKHFDFFNSGILTQASAKFLSNILPTAHEKQSNYNYAYRLLKFTAHDSILKTYSSATSDIMVGFEDQFLIPPNLDEIDYDLRKINQMDISSLRKMLLMDSQTILFSGLLPKMDIATMSHSLEGRSPFLSKELLEFAPSLNDSYKINGLKTKSILRDLSKKYLPHNLVKQPKRGFEIPLKNWINNQLYEIVNDYLLSSNALYPSIIKKKFVLDLLERRIQLSEEKRAKILFDVFAMEVWHKNIIKSTIPKRELVPSFVEV
jgi:asparagine synthase (glutamine-hydrolysing)